MLKTLKGQKRKRELDNPMLSNPGAGPDLAAAVSSMGAFNNISSTNSAGGSSAGDDDEAGKKKKVRTTFTGRQIFELEKMFETKKYLSSSERADMAKLLNVTEQQVGI